MNKLINIAKRLSRSITSKDAQEVYDKIRKDKVLSQIIPGLEAENFILLCFLIAANNKKMNLESTFAQFHNFLLSFSLIHIQSDIPEESCDYCSGDGQISCSECGGSGYEECPDCEGDGEDSERDTCGYCDGEGRIECSVCDGDGSEICDNCNGDGYIEDDSRVNFEVIECITISNHIFNLLESKELEVPIDFELWDHIMADRETIKLHFYSGVSDNFDTDLRNEYMIYETNITDIMLARQSSDVVRDNFLSDVD